MEPNPSNQPPSSQPPPMPTSGQAAPPEAPAPQYEPYVPKKTNVWLIVGIVVGAVLLLLILLAAILLPAVISVSRDAEYTRLKSNGKNIFTVVMADALGEKTIGFPQEGQYETSTGYLKELAPTLRAPAEFVSGPYTDVAVSWQEFRAEHNAWCIVEGQSVTTPFGTPFMLSSNITVNDLSELTGPISKTIRPGKKTGYKVVVVGHGGMARAALGEQTWEEVLGPSTYSGRILHP